MPTWEVKIPDNKEKRIVDAFAEHYSYPKTVMQTREGSKGEVTEEVKNPQSKEEFAKECLVRHIMDVVGISEARVAETKSREAAQSKSGDLGVSI